MEEITLKSRIKNFKVFFTDNFEFIDKLISDDNSVAVVGRMVYKLYKEKIFSKFPKNRLIVIPLTEETKTLDTVLELYCRLLKFPFKKNLTIISFGGGINQDVVGFTASTLYRGVRWIYVPTTLLSQADSAIGLKTSLNLSSFKNVVGSFYPPNEIYINPEFLDTLEDLYYLSGLGEIIKLFLMDDNSIKKLPEIAKEVAELKSGKDKNHILAAIKKCMKIKLSYMQGDEFDQGRRNLLNYGHEFGHAIEPVSNYNIPHGVAVILGMLFANIASRRRGLLEKDTFDFLNNQILLTVLDTGIIKLKREFFDKKKILSKMKQDKKRTGESLVLVMPAKNLVFEKIIDYSVGEFGRDYKTLMGVVKPFFYQ